MRDTIYDSLKWVDEQNTQLRLCPKDFFYTEIGGYKESGESGLRK